MQLVATYPARCCFCFTSEFAGGGKQGAKFPVSWYLTWYLYWHKYFLNIFLIPDPAYLVKLWTWTERWTLNILWNPNCHRLHQAWGEYLGLKGKNPPFPDLLSWSRGRVRMPLAATSSVTSSAVWWQWVALLVLQLPLLCHCWWTMTHFLPCSGQQRAVCDDNAEHFDALVLQKEEWICRGSGIILSSFFYMHIFWNSESEMH